MQLKLLNFYKMIANVANNLVGAFVPLIIYDATGSLFYACLFLFGCNLTKLMSSLLLNKFIQHNPEIFLLCRFFSMGSYCICLGFMSYNLILFSILGAIFLGLDGSFKTLANETLFNYSSGVKADSKSIGVTRVFEQLGVFAGIIVGGLLLDVSQVVVYVLAVVLYFIAIIPLFMFYLKNRHKEAFNTEFVSTATMQLSQKKDDKPVKYIGFMILLSYAIVYFCYSVCDVVPNMFNLDLASGGGLSYSYASMFVLTFNVFYFVGNMIVSKLDKKFDLLKVVQVSCFIISIMFICFAFVTNVVILFICFGVFGLVYSFLCAFMLQRLLQKSRILGISNKAFVIREEAGYTAYATFYGVSTLLVGIKIDLCWFFVISAVMLIVTGLILPRMEERTRKMLVDYVEDNDIIVNNKSKEVE